MQKERQRKEIVVLCLCFALFLASAPLSSASPAPAFHGDEVAEADALLPSFLSPEEVAAFSNTTANGVRREGVDTALRKYAFMTLSHARTGIIYNVSLPPFLDGILCQAMRVRVGSARKRGVTFNEFSIPQGFIVQTGGPFVIMVYRKIFDFTLYTSPLGSVFASSFVGIVIYTNTNTTLDDSPLPEMTVLSPNTSITATLTISPNIPRGPSVPFGCALYDINGTASFTNVSSYPNICSLKILTDVALIVPTSVIATPPPPPASAKVTAPPSAPKRTSNTWKIVVVAVVGGVVGLALLIAIIVMGLKVGDECQMTRVDEPPDDEETLQTSLIGHTRAPTAAGVRTRPVLETGSLHT
eukprot:c9680_g1_i1 orf=146-1213(+)